jgi:hypothetical protein
MSLRFFADPGMTLPLAGLYCAQAADGSAAAVDRVIYLGATDIARRYRAATNPGVDPIEIVLVDASGGAGVAITDVALATSQAGLATATPGAALAIGTEILSGHGNAVAIYVRINTPALADGEYADVSLSTGTLLDETL